MMSAGATIRPIISTGIRIVVTMNDFLRTRSLNSRVMIIPIFEFAMAFYFCLFVFFRLLRV